MNCPGQVWTALAVGGVLGALILAAALAGALAWAYRKGVRGC